MRYHRDFRPSLLGSMKATARITADPWGVLSSRSWAVAAIVGLSGRSRRRSESPHAGFTGALTPAAWRLTVRGCSGTGNTAPPEHSINEQAGFLCVYHMARFPVRRAAIPSAASQPERRLSSPNARATSSGGVVTVDMNLTPTWSRPFGTSGAHWATVELVLRWG